MKQMTLLLTCEHGGNQIPPGYHAIFEQAENALNSHRGYDLGALPVALTLASAFACPFFFSTVTRLLIDLNRSLDHPQLFSEYANQLNEKEKQQVVTKYYQPYREHVSQTVKALIQLGQPVVHLGIHSFTDVLNGCVREMDVGLLFDPSRGREQVFCQKWQETLQKLDPKLRYRLNEPYQGCDDGLTTTLRAAYTDDVYLGLELEIRQGLLTDPGSQQRLANLIQNSLREMLG